MPGRLVLLVLLAALFGAPSAASAARNEAAAATTASRPEAAKEPIGPGGLAGEASVLLWLLGGLMGVTALAVVGTALVSGRRRHDDHDGTRAAAAQKHETTSVLERRSVRRARMRLDDDPIVASLGVGNARDRSRPRRRAAHAIQNAAERDGRPQRS